MKNSRLKSLLNSIFKFCLAGGLIYWLISTGRLDLNSVSALFRSSYFFVGFFFIGLNLWLASERWRLLATPQNVPASSWEMFRLSLVGVFFNYAMPGGVGGDVIKAYYFGKDHPQARAAAITSVILDRVLGLYAMILMAVSIMLLDHARVFAQPTLRTLFLILILLATAFSLGFLSLFSRRIKSRGWIEKILGHLPLSTKFLKLYETAHRFGLMRARVVTALALSIFAQSVSILFLWVAGLAAGFNEVPLLTYFLVAPLGFMATAIPISPAGLGVGQAAFLVLFNLYLGHPSPLGPVVITSLQVMTAIYGLAGAFFYIRRKDRVSTGELERAAATEENES